MASSTHVVVDPVEHEYLNQTNDKPAVGLTTDDKAALKKAGRKTAIVTAVLLIPSSIIPILQLYFGTRYTDQCPVEKHIPHYLVVSGGFGLFVIVSSIIQSLLTIKFLLSTVSNPEETPKFGILGILGCLLCGTGMIAFFLFIWLIIGCVWIFGVWNTVQYVDPNQNNYCHPTLFRLAYWSLFLSLIFKFLSCSISRLMSNQMRALRNRKTLSTTVQP